MTNATYLAKRFTLAAIFVTLLILTVQVASAGGVDPEIVYDSRICGRDGNVTSANTYRWTDVFGTADPNTTTGNALEPNTAVTILGRDFWGCWVSVTSSSYNGWVPVNSLDEVGVMGLPILVDNSNGCEIIGNRVACPFDNASSNTPPLQPSVGPGSYTTTVSRWTNIYSGADVNSATGNAVPEGGTITVTFDTGTWARIESDFGNGYIPSNALR